ncbi:GNAT family N-acetyltransferase [Aurantiacibacter gangjinensis]|uniref:Uncharacterized protein n=1 Tax=Aurantiacibacter gangjinensis TaxID=502682 RepID=A0A0G9MT76_9SPHN|nr:GNAT family N-acetyltransferase [Aurantiacibacter gangjinensis]APE28268.1 Ribosomal-protein-S18p-alanine acetyltransferase [Aurantiacibacter gangjinensis]KLE32513.1 hypothetical protein AAW01_00075 [Aurantiacibacter gangjinensis]
MTDALDAIMLVMGEAFDSRFGEAWTRKQVADSLVMPGVHFVLADRHGVDNVDIDTVTGFALTRQAADEEEILLIAVRPASRGTGIAQRLLEEVIARAKMRDVRHLFLEMRDGNPAEHLYRRFGFQKIGHRKGYYRGAVGGPLDAITFARSID